MDAPESEDKDEAEEEEDRKLAEGKGGTSEPAEIGIRVRLTGTHHFPTMFVAQSLAMVEDEVFAVEYEELAAIFAEFPDISSVVRDACYERIRRYEGGALLLEDAAKGSLILGGAAAALAYWIVENTVGESFKEAWKGSDLHQKLRRLFLSRIDARGNELKRRLDERFFKPVKDPTVVARVTFERNGNALIDVELRLAKLDRVPPAPSEWIGSGEEKKRAQPEPGSP